MTTFSFADHHLRGERNVQRFILLAYMATSLLLEHR